MRGLYKVEYWLGDALGRSVMYARDGVMLGGNSAFAHLGSYRTDADGLMTAHIDTLRHNPDPAYKPLLGRDIATLVARGGAPNGSQGGVLRFEGASEQLPGVIFRSVMTPLDEATCPPPGTVGQDSIVNGLYSIHIRMLDGIGGGNTGVMLLLDGQILGGDAYFYYLGSYSSASSRWKGEMVNQEHTPAKHAKPLFGGHEVGIGFTGSCDAQSAQAEATALVGKRSIRFAAELKLLRKA